MDEIVVTGTRQAYQVTRSSSATRSDTDLIDVPQAVSVVTARQIRDQAMHSIADVLRAVPGASVNGGEGHRDHIVLRGNSSTADFFVDGLRDDVQYYRGLYNVERVEVLKGPNAMVFGRGGGGGVVNRVSKRPESGSFVRLAASLDSEGAWDVSADLNTPLSASVNGRINLARERFDSFREANGGQRFAVNPTVAWHIDSETRLDLGVEYVRDRRVVDRGVPADFTGRLADPAPPLAGYDEVFFGQRGTNRARFTGKIATAAFEHRFSPVLRFVAKGLAGDYDKMYRNAQPATAAATVDGVRKVGIEAYESSIGRRSLLGQADLIAEVVTGPVQHTIVAGIDYAHQRSHSNRFQGFFDAAGTVTRATVPLSDPIVIPPIFFRDGAVNHFGHTDAIARGEALGAYL
ncbi:MAG: TonB-dependent receptor [Sphingomicrobium sp.]|nr:TonB-dependent receptor plug domain-containing protein [Sphingomonadales bacterium]